MAIKKELNCSAADPAFFDLIDLDAGLEQVATGFDFVEGPIWHPTYKSVLFSDIMGNSLFSWRQEDGVVQRRRNSYMANGNAYDLEGRLLTCEHATSRLTRTNLSVGEYEVLASHYDGLELNSPNDVVVDRNGAIYFTDPTSGRSEGYGVPRPPQLPFSGVYRLDPDSGRLDLLIDDFEKPNGLCFSKDQKRLFVNDTVRQHIRVFDINAEGLLENGQLWADLVGKLPGVADGMKIDAAENVYCCGPGGIQIFDSQAKHLGSILMPEQTANFVFGDDDLCSLYITASTSLYRIRVRQAGWATFTPA